MEKITRKAALCRGLKRYYTGKACKRGHVAERMVSTMTCVECKNERERRLYWEDPEKARRLARDWQDRNRERHNARAVAYQVRRVKEDPFHRLKVRTRIMVLNALTRRGYSKRTKTQEVLGCGWQFFLAHIERQFLPGMGWENRHLWHIDHITPLSAATTEEEVLALNHFTNLRPIWAKDNLQKSDLILFLI